MPPKLIVIDTCFMFIACTAYEDCLDMVASGKVYATLINVNEASRMQKEIHARHLRITKLIERPYPYLVFFYTNDENKAKIKKLVQCLDTVSQVFMDMLKAHFIPKIQYTTMEIVDPFRLFTVKPYVGAVMVAIIALLSLVGILTDVFCQWYAKHHGRHGK